MIRLLILLTAAIFKLSTCALVNIEVKDTAAIAYYQCAYRTGENIKIMEVKIVHHFAEFIPLPMQFREISA
ncbi:MAG: hypothetical protein MUO42_12465 [Anaerolineaceae bacterium]|nr:hypothetical protein [Anaerolineaceae bacterium]